MTRSILNQSAMERLSLEEKVGQVFMFGFPGKDPEGARELVLDLKVGGIIYFARNTGSVREVASLSHVLQGWAMGSHSGGVPLFISADQEGGIVSRLTEGIPVMPGAMSLAAAGGPELVYEVSRATAIQLRSAGINMNLAPVLDVNDNPENPVIGVRSFGSDPHKVAELGSAATRGFMAGGVVPVGKHFPGHGNTSIDSHLDLPVISLPRTRLDQVELVPYRRAIAEGLPAIMSAHIVFQTVDPGRPATLSAPVLQGLLRKELGFQGVIMTDCLEMNAISKDPGTVQGAVMAFKAGCDMLLISHTRDLQKRAYEALLEAVRIGEVSEERLNQAVARILRLKETLALPNPLPVESADTEELRELSKTAHRKSITLVRNLENLVPLKVRTRVRESGAGTSGGTVDDSGDGGILLISTRPRRMVQVEDAPKERHLAAPDARKKTPTGWTRYESLDALMGTLRTDLGRSLARYGWPDLLNSVEEVFMEDEGAMEKCLLLAKNARAVVIVSQNAKKDPGQARFIQTLVSKNPGPMILVAARDPYDIHLVPEAKTYICTYNSRPEAMDALAEVLTGRSPAEGKLPVTGV